MSDFTHYLQDLQENIQRGSERSHYPALKSLIDGLMIGINAIIEEKGNQIGIPDLTVRRNDILIGYVEAKDIDRNLDKLEETEQIKRYRESAIGHNLILTNYLEFRWYTQGKHQLTTQLATFEQGKIIPVENLQLTAELLRSFLSQKAKDINDYYDLAREMASYTKAIKYAIALALTQEDSTGELTKSREMFKDLLLPDLDNQSFADMYAQTIAYGLFTARIGHAQNPGKSIFNRQTASLYISDKISFLKRLFSIAIETENISKIYWSIERLIELLRQVEMNNILEVFGRETRTEDPVIHFYETFLAAYESGLRKSRGVYYTPEPIVSFIVRSVNNILDEVFDLQYGLGHRRVTILDPATGTGTFLYAVIKQIYRNVEKYGINRWNTFLRDAKLLKRLYGFELLMTPYTIAHLKLGLLLESLGYQFQPEERLKIYLTNALEEGVKQSELLLSKFIAEEANQARAVKAEIPIIVVLGNPPYSVSSQNASKRKRIVNQDTEYLADIKYTGSAWNKIYKTAKSGKNITELTNIGELLERYKGRVRLDGERNIQPLDDDYIKFIRFAQHQIEKTGYGVIGFITNHSYINGLIHRGMREELLKYFDTLYVMDLHGNSLLKETTPDGGIDQNVFDIQQGVAILIAVREKSEPDYFSTAFKPRDGVKEMAKVRYFDLWGIREDKYKFLEDVELNQIDWIELQPADPNYFFAPKDFDLAAEYNQAWSVTDIFPINSTGVKTHRDNFVMDFDLTQLRQRIEDFRNLRIANEHLSDFYDLRDTRDWKIAAKRSSLTNNSDWENYFTTCLYRPFDTRFYYHHQDVVELLRQKVMFHVFKKENLCLITARGIEIPRVYDQIFCTNQIISNHSLSIKEINYLFPLYTYPDTKNSQTNLFLDRNPNLSPNFLAAIEERLGKTPTPEEIFYYAYAIFHCPTYRNRYAEFLKIDFPRLPLTSNHHLFEILAKKGAELVDLHLLKSDVLNTSITTYQGAGDNQVTEVTYNAELQRVSINKECYFVGITEQIWEFKIGGYQVLDKWLKDRKNAHRVLSTDEIIHYQKIVVALKETMILMEEIDSLIPSFPLQ